MTPCWTHTFNICGFAPTYFYTNPPTQWFKSFEQNYAYCAREPWKTRITWNWGPKCCLLCIDLSHALGTCIFLQCRTLHCKTKRAPINMPKAIPINNLTDHYPTLKKYRIHTLWNTWGPMDVQVVNNVRLKCKNGDQEINMIEPMWFII